MSRWTSIEGSVVSKKVSIKKIINEVLEGEDKIFYYGGEGKFSGRFERDGDSAIKAIQEIVERIKSFDPKARGEIEVNTVIEF